LSDESPNGQQDRSREGSPIRRGLGSGWWRSATAVAVGIVLAVGLLALIHLLARPLALLILAIAIASAVAPLVSSLGNRIPRALAAILVYLVGLALLVGAFSIIIPPLVGQAREIGERAPDLIEQAQSIFDWDRLSFLPLDAILPQLGALSSTIISLPIGLASSLLEILLVVFISLYLVIEAPNLERFVLSLVPAEREERLRSLLHEMTTAMGGYIRGVLMSAVLVGFFTYLGLLIIGVDFPLVLGLLAGLFEVIPYLGPILAAIPIVIIALLESTTQAIIVVIFIVILQQVESYVIVPNVMRSQTKVSPLLVILAIIAGSTLGGLLGVLIAIPVVGALRVFVREVIAPAIRRQTGAPEHKAEPVVEEVAAGVDE
jgi:predicted PurR-regulated permease PerM